MGCLPRCSGAGPVSGRPNCASGGEPPRPNCAPALGHVIKLSGFVWPYNPPCMALPCCPPFAQGGLRRAAGPVSGRLKLAEGFMRCLPSCSGAGEPAPGRTIVQSRQSAGGEPPLAKLSLPFFIEPAGCGSTVWVPRHCARNNTPPTAKKTGPMGTWFPGPVFLLIFAGVDTAGLGAIAGCGSTAWLSGHRTKSLPNGRLFV